MKRRLSSLILILLAPALFAPALAGAAEPPGIVIDYIPASTGVYIGSPSIAVLPNGDYVASHDHFGPKTKEYESALTSVFRSTDRGRSWTKISQIQGQFWSSLFVHRGTLYILGPDRHHGNPVIRRSADGGVTWTEPTDAKTGLLRDDGQYHCAPMPVIEHAGRLWRGMERRDPPVGWGITYCAGMLSAPVDADMLDAANWAFSNFLPSDAKWLDGSFGGWLEGNAVVTREGRLVDMLRVDTRGYPEKAALVKISDDGRRASFDPQDGFVDFPGGAKKFTVRFDARTEQYWSLATIVPERHQLAGRPGAVRNTLALTCSPDLHNWTVRCILLYHPDTANHGFQYVDWLFDGDDLIAACRTAFDDGRGGAHNFHDANYLTFHRIKEFRDKTMADSVPLAELPLTRAETREFVLTGRGWTLARLADDEQAFGNRQYVWQKVPADFRGWQLTRTNGGERAEIQVQARCDTTLFIATAGSQKTIVLAGWDAVEDATFHYTDAGKTAMAIFRRAVKAGEELRIPQGNWTGALVLVPPDKSAP